MGFYELTKWPSERNFWTLYIYSEWTNWGQLCATQPTGAHTMLRRILLAIDDSLSSQNAQRLALELAT